MPLECTDQCEPVCTCQGFDYDSTCKAVLANRVVFEIGPCDPQYVRDVRWRLTNLGNVIIQWDWIPDSPSYNIYRYSRLGAPPTNAGSCFFAGYTNNGSTFPWDPEPGETWLFQITANFESGEGPMGVSSDCSPRMPSAPCVLPTSSISAD